jgi:hypothetical protein
MLLPLHSDEVIEALVMMNCGESASAQARHLYRESLRSLVRLAKVEHGAELRFKLSRPNMKPDKNTVH